MPVTRMATAAAASLAAPPMGLTVASQLIRPALGNSFANFAAADSTSCSCHPKEAQLLMSACALDCHQSALGLQIFMAM